MSILTPGMVNSEGTGLVLKAKIFHRKYEAKLEIPAGLGGG